MCIVSRLYKKKVLFIFGTRPEVIKLVPLSHEFKRDNFFRACICVTAQRPQMLDQVLEIFNIKPDYGLDLMADNQSLNKDS